MVNCTHDSMTKAYDKVLTALTYIRGPMVNDWVDTQENNLVTRTDTTQPNHVREDDEVLWTEFETAFNDAWTDTSKKQNAYDQLMKLTMAGWDIDTYIATFERLALAAGWALNANGTIVRFREALRRGIHSKALDRDKKFPTPWTNGKQQHVPRSPELKKNTTQGSQIYSVATNRCVIITPPRTNTAHQTSPTRTPT